MTNNGKEPQTDTLAETDNYMVWKAEEPDGETTFVLFGDIGKGIGLGRPGWHRIIAAFVMGQIGQIAAVAIHNIDFSVAIAITDKSNARR